MKASALYFTTAKKKTKSNVKRVENMVMPLCKSVDCLYVDYYVPFWSLHLCRNVLVLKKVQRGTAVMTKGVGVTERTCSPEYMEMMVETEEQRVIQ